jgi:hypothetical protein
MSKTPPNLSELWPTQSVELLKALHILTRDGALNQDSRRKLKQVQHLVQLVTPQLANVKTLADLGAGKSYLGFMLYDLWMRDKPGTHLWAIEQRPELVSTCRALAKDSGFDRISFVAQSILEASTSSEVPPEIDAVTALHACDTATDEAIAFGLRKKAKVIALVPCCQAEAARLLPSLPSETTRELKSLWSHNLHRREFGSHITNVIRTLFLESRGYKVRVTELIGWEHSMKNELIIAERTDRPVTQARRYFEDFMARFPLPMKLFDLVPPAEDA